MKITKAELIEMGACRVGLERFIKQTNDTDEAVEVASLVGGENTYSDLMWLASKKSPQGSIVRFACDCALINIELIKPYTNDYDIIVEFLRDPVGHTHTDIYDATRAAADATYAAAAAEGRSECIDTYMAKCAAHAAADAIDAAATEGNTEYIATYMAKCAAYAAHHACDKEKVNELLKEMFA